MMSTESAVYYVTGCIHDSPIYPFFEFLCSDIHARAHTHKNDKLSLAHELITNACVFQHSTVAHLEIGLTVACVGNGLTSVVTEDPVWVPSK